MAIPMKRGRQSSAGAPAAKRAKVSKEKKVVPPSLKKKESAIKASLMKVPTLSQSTRKMLCSALNDCFTVGKDARHAVQAQFAEMVGQALGDLGNSYKEKLDASNAVLASLDSEKANLDKTMADAAAAAADRANVVAEKKASLKEADANSKAAEVAHKEAESAQKQGVKDLEAVEGKNAMLAAARSEAFVPLRDGPELPANVKQLVKQAIKAGEECDFDAAMLTSLHDALSKPLADRGTFDQLVIRQFEEESQKAADAFNMAIRSAAPGKEERAASFEASKTALTQAYDHQVAAKQQLTEARTQHDAAEADHKAAQDQVKDFAKSNKAKAQAAEADDKALQNFKNGALRCYEDLKNWDGKPPERKVSPYQIIKKRRYERKLLDIAKAAGAGGITKESAEALFTSAMDGIGVTPTEKRTLKYIIKNYTIDEESKNFLDAKMGSSWYQQIEGVTYERSLLQMAAEGTQPLGLEVAENLWASANDGNLVTPTEKASLEYVLRTYAFTEEAGKFLGKKVNGSKVFAD
jgi:hypothetical protein